MPWMHTFHGERDHHRIYYLRVSDYPVIKWCIKKRQGAWSEDRLRAALVPFYIVRLFLTV